ncbi:MAG: hypothetical protein MR874_05160 [Coriobacteriaceae bacterium]|nr:hypothetical protein [Coriobacteriaceae bacterium]MCI7439021.1 hypothetical protein [Coriobacteriaceae bacterium]
MSGGEYSAHGLDCPEVDWEDRELRDLWDDLTGGEEFSVRGYGGLLQSLDFYACGDIDREDYQRSVRAFKDKWFHRTPRNRIDFYRAVIQRCADECKRELGLDGGGHEDDQ